MNVFQRRPGGLPSHVVSFLRQAYLRDSKKKEGEQVIQVICSPSFIIFFI
jgi:hypothetical protein